MSADAFSPAPTGKASSGSAAPPPVVGIGASAGGLKALKTFFEHVDPAGGLAYVVVVHLAPERESQLAEILQPHTSLPVTQVTEATRIEPDHVYVIPPGRNLDAVDTHLRLSALEESRSLRAPIDHFFRTLAGAAGSRPVAVVLTGTGSDGTLGLREVKLQAGLTIAQDPNEAEFDGMPQSAIATGLVDLVLPLTDIPGAILRFSQTQPRVPLGDGEPPEAVADAERRALRRLFAHLLTRTGRDFSRYKRSTILRRVTRRMRMAHVEELTAYLAVLHERPAEALALADDLLITVTHFFRDAEVFESVAEDVIPAIMAGAGPEGTVRVWSVGCATGEEAYSLAILLLEAAARHEVPPRIQVFATDLHEESLRRAREGLYLGDIESTVSAERLARFFQPEAGGYRIRKEVRDLVVFASHNLLGDPPFSRLDLVTCRNVLIYLQRDVQRDVIELFHYALRPDGVLVLGTSETVESPELFRVLDKKRCLYRKRNVPAQEPRLPVFPGRGGRRTVPDHPLEPVPFRSLHQRLLDAAAPASLLLGPDDKVAHVSGDAGRFLAVPGGELTSSAFRLVREELRVELRAALLSARHHAAPARSEPVELAIDGDLLSVVVDVRPSQDPETDGFALVLFDVRPAPRPPAAGTDSDERVVTLGDELERTRRRLQSVLDEDDSGREALRASNEELQSANEELRSTMEELETSKEELQSMNEELQTVNQENRHKVMELAQLTGDLQNLLAATEIATLFLDRDLHILRFTPPVTRLFNVRPADSGRPLTDLTHRLGDNELAADAAEVLRTLAPIERELRDEAGRWYLTRVLPYRSPDDRIEGVVITFVDLSARKAAEEALRQSEERLRQLSDAVPDVLFSLGPDGLVDSVSSQIQAIAGVAPASLIGTPMWSTLIHPEDREAAAAAWAGARDGGDAFEARYRLLRTAGEACWVIARARLSEGPDGVRRWFGSLTDVDALTRAEAGLRELNATLEERVQRRTAEVRTLAAQLTVAEQRERQRIAYVLHEDLQQVLTGAQIAAEVGSDKLPGLLDRALHITRTLSHELSPPLLQGEGLAELLEWVVARKKNLHGLSVALDIRGRVVVPEAHLRVLVYQTVRELLLNVVKHAGILEARIVVTAVPGYVRVVVEDDGAGFDPEEGSAPGLGLSSVAERVELVGGRLSVEAEPGEGTRVAFEIPSLPGGS